MALSTLLLVLSTSLSADSTSVPSTRDSIGSPALIAATKAADSTPLPSSAAKDSASTPMTPIASPALAAQAVEAKPGPATTAVGPIPGPVVVIPPPAYGPVTSDNSGPVTIVQIDTSGSGTSGRSTLAAVGLSLLVPGWGHRYLGYTGRATPYFATELAARVALFGSWVTGRVAIANAAEIANRHAGAQLGSDPDPNLVSAIRSYRSRRQVDGRNDSYDEAMALSNKSSEFEFPNDAAHNWDWGTRENPENDAHIRSFENQVRLWRGTRVAIYSTAGALALVRIVATMDVLRLNRSAAGRAGISLETRPLPGGMDATLAVNF